MLCLSLVPQHLVQCLAQNDCSQAFVECLAEASSMLPLSCQEALPLPTPHIQQSQEQRGSLASEAAGDEQQSCPGNTAETVSSAPLTLSHLPFCLTKHRVNYLFLLPFSPGAVGLAQRKTWWLFCLWGN